MQQSHFHTMAQMENFEVPVKPFQGLMGSEEFEDVIAKMKHLICQALVQIYS